MNRENQLDENNVARVAEAMMRRVEQNYDVYLLPNKMITNVVGRIDFRDLAIVAIKAISQ